MKTKKIVADSIPLALKMVRQQLGDNAIIVNTRSIKTGGFFGFFTKQKFEVTAYAAEKEEPRDHRTIALGLIEKAGESLVEKNNPDSQKFEPIELDSRKIHIEKKSEQVTMDSQSVDKAEVEDKNNSVFHKKPQMLYQYYAQTAEKGVSEVETKTPQSVETETELINEIKDLRKMMMVFMTSEKQGNTSSTRLSKWINRLKKKGVDDEVLEYIVIYTINSMLNRYGSLVDASDEVIEKEMISIIQGIIEKRIPKTTNPNEDVRMIKIIGPTGVGKTTSIAKLATEQILKQKRRVALVTTDVYRIGAVEQLKTYAGILNVPIEVARSSDELNQALTNLAHYDLIYMDTTGRNYKDEKNRESVAEFLHHPIKSDNYLALSLTTKYEDLRLLLDEFLESPVNKLILTKFDETTNYGSILNIAYKYPYHIAYITNGQSVPEDITVIDAPMLASSLVGDDL
ncbi:flagellar biosynthesis protein FlhF [Neobacillus sp. MM2021_6]|uniref:flagellar biosynthesis protein FlhF n=1 Tax=Bacillaceae TaxID=186817 RepID=UPI00140E5DB6|nr:MULTISPECIES: flagellar biosynthesis protein FlhF [Bacillaceae]MBO0961074.1 flagellar biosynthesis protein FlhF [Neobacillus sp. MM2021_6]NHC20668.1 flagellar biosynthesis protein FlhF [Bacillus sp. MM2020_4]